MEIHGASMEFHGVILNGQANRELFICEIQPHQDFKHPRRAVKKKCYRRLLEAVGSSLVILHFCRTLCLDNNPVTLQRYGVFLGEESTYVICMLFVLKLE